MPSADLFITVLPMDEEQDPTQMEDVGGIFGSVEQVSLKVTRIDRPIFDVLAAEATGSGVVEATRVAKEAERAPKERDFPNAYFVSGRTEEKGCKETAKRVVEMV